MAPRKPKNASEAVGGTEQDPTSEAEVQEQGSEGASAEEQEQLAQLRSKLLQDPSFLDELISSPTVQSRLQADRDQYVHSQTLTLKQQLEQVERDLQAATAANNPVMLEYQRLKDEGLYEEALTLLENQNQISEREARARQEGEAAAATAILQRIRASETYKDLTQEEWTSVYAKAAAQAQSQGRNYVTVDEYVAGANSVLREKEKSSMNSEEQQKAIEAAVEARLKEAGITRRAEEGGPENLGGRRGSGGTPSDEEVMNMPQEEWNALPDEQRKEILRRGAELATRS